MDDITLKELLAKYREGTCTDEEKALLENWVTEVTYPEYHISEKDLRNDLAAIRQNLPVAGRSVRLWPRIAAAASILLALGTGTFFLLNKQKTNPAAAANDVAPYTAMAILKSGGKTIVLDKTANGKISQTPITKSSGELLAYEAVNEGQAAVYDTIQIPAGGRPYTIKLSDGSKVTLNAATTLRYPESFSRTRKEQIELISGEAYFSIAHFKNAPLTIRAKDQIIEDIGTEFNVNTYREEPDSRTTLVEGAVKVNKRALLPGQQAIVMGTNLTIAKADVEQTTAWKNGYFRFNGEQIQTIMRELSRWYNIEVKYEGKISHEGYYVKISRSKNISEVLRVLERTNSVRFKIEGRRVTVLSKK